MLLIMLKAAKQDWILWAWVCGLLLLSIIFLGPALFPPEGTALGGLDIRGLFYPWLNEAREAVLSGRLPLWGADQFAGYPFLANPQVGLFYPPTCLAILLPVRIGLSWYIVQHLWLASTGMLLLIRRLTTNWLAAGLSAIAFAFSGFIAAR